MQNNITLSSSKERVLIKGASTGQRSYKDKTMRNINKRRVRVYDKLIMFLIISLAIGITTSCDNGTTSLNESNESETEGNKGPTNVLPVCDAGVNQTVTTDFVILNGKGQDWDGYIVSYIWSKTSGPEGCIIHYADSPSAVVIGLKPGTYVFTLTVTDNVGGRWSDYTTVTVKYKDIVLPICDAGDDQTITLPTNTIILNGTAHDSDGEIIAYKWKALLGPGVNEGDVVISNDTSISTTVSGLQKGIYVFILTVTDNDNHQYSDSVTVTVKGS